MAIFYMIFLYLFLRKLFLLFENKLISSRGKKVGTYVHFLYTINSALLRNILFTVNSECFSAGFPIETR